MQGLFTFFVHASIVVGMLAWLRLIWGVVLEGKSGVESMIRRGAVICGPLVVLGAKAIGISIPGLLIQSGGTAKPITFGLLGVIAPGVMGTVLAWYAARAMHGSTNVAVRLFILVGMATITIFGDVYAAALKADGFNVSRLLAPNIIFIVAMLMYVILKYDPEKRWST